MADNNGNGSTVINAHDYINLATGQNIDHLNFKPGEQNHQVEQYYTAYPTAADPNATAHDVIIEVNHDGVRQATNLVQHVHGDGVNIITHQNLHSGDFFHA